MTQKKRAVPFGVRRGAACRTVFRQREKVNEPRGPGGFRKTLSESWRSFSCAQTTSFNAGEQVLVDNQNQFVSGERNPWLK